MVASIKLRHLLASVVCISLLAHPLFAADAAAPALTAADFAAAANKALGATDVHGIEFTAKGWDACLGQAWSVAEGWARWELSDYRRVIDYADSATRHSAQRRAGMDAGHIGGCGAQPNARSGPQQSFVDASSAWPDQLVMWLTPQGFMHLFAASLPVIAKDPAGWQVTLPIERNSIGYQLMGHFNASFEMDSIRTWVDDSVFGDMEVQAAFGKYQHFNGLSFPQTLAIKEGGFPILSLSIDSASLNSETLVRQQNPGGGRPPAPAATGPGYTSIGTGIFVMSGTYQSVAVEFKDYSVVIDGLQNDSRVQELIRLVKKAIPNKPIRYVVSTHSHFDHASGLRQFAAEGATILTHKMNVDFFRKALAAPRTLRLKPTEPNVVVPLVQGIDGYFELSDGAGQTLDLYALGPSEHAADMLIAWLPSIKTVVEADTLQPWSNPVFSGGNGPHPFVVYLSDELKKLKLDYQSFVPIHAPPMPPMMSRADLEAVLNKK